LISTLHQERFSDAFITAIAAMAHCSCAKPQPDEEGVDWVLGANLPGLKLRYPRIEVQLKSTGLRNLRTSATNITYDLEVKAYEKLICRTMIPRLLVVVTLPDDPALWLAQTVTDTALKHSAFFVNLLGSPATANTSTIAVDVPISNHLTPTSLLTLMTRAGNLLKL
jgi:hypothetical protein